MAPPESLPARIARAATPVSGSRGCGPTLPADLMEKAVLRLGWVALIYVASHVILRFVYHFTYASLPEQPLDIGGIFPSSFPLADVGIAGAVISGVLVCVLAWSRKLPPALMLDIGLLFEVVGALWISLVEFATPVTYLRAEGTSSISIWIVFFILVVPATFGKTTLAAFASAAMGPVGLIAAALYYGVEMPEPGLWFRLFFPIFWYTAWAVLLSRFLYSMGCDVGKARELGSYALLEPLGSGGMGEVWKVQHRMLARDSALKMIRPDVCAKTDARGIAMHRRFEREVRATAGLRSPHTVAVYDFGMAEDGCFYYVMELLDGLDLESLVERYGPLPPERVIHFLRQACDSLAEAHHNCLVHRDIKPTNIFACRLGLNYDFIKVLDFGLVKSDLQADESQTRLTVDGTTTGTPAYMAPEMALGKPVDARTDLYGLGCVGYWLLTGRLVFEGSTPAAVLLAHLQETPVPPSQRAELEIPASLERAILSCLEKDAAKRPQSAQELSRQLAACRCDVRETWNQERAERWWRTHMPATEARPRAEQMAVAERQPG